YNLTFEQGKLVIAKADATVTANSDLNKVYNGQIQSVNGFTVDGLVGNDTKSDLVGFTGDSANGKDVGTYNTNLGLGTYVGNYNLTFEQGKLTIAPKDISVVADNKSKIQGDGNPDLTYDVVGLIGNDTLNGSLETNALKDSLAGDYDITKGSLENSNYNIKDFTNGTLSVLAKVVPTPEPESTPQIQAIIDGNERSVNQTQNKSSVDTKHNVNILSLNTIKDTKIVNGGIRMPENIVTKEEDIIK
ncbi:MBG domain-containing protein, partial [Arcobacter sp. CECT 9188]|uniref:MBG domain-containing protein n=2 Tax=Arcobacteraceae TaxID=2808963 RepID=UPI000DFCF40C